MRTETTRGVHTALYALTRPLRPLARLGARPGYFSRRDWATFAPRRIALVACHWIGDTFWATQVVPALARRFPGAELFALCKPATADLWHGLVPPHRVLPAPEIISDRRRERTSLAAIRRRAKELRPLDFDLVVDLTGNRYSALFTYRLRPAGSMGFDGGEVGWLYSRRVNDAQRPGRHLSERPFRVIEPLLANSPGCHGCDVQQPCSAQRTESTAANSAHTGRPAVAPPAAAAPGGEPFAYRLPLRPPAPTCTPNEARGELGASDRPYFVLAPGAGWPAKEWPAEKFVQAGAALASEGTVAVVGSDREEDLCRRVAGGIAGAKTCAGRPIGRVVALLAEARGVLANDSGIAHLAAALGRPTAAVFTDATDEATCRPLGPEGAARTFRHADDVGAIVRHLLA